ncbi:UBN1 family protein [Megaselia abdita]
MSEVKRVALTTIISTSNSGSTATTNGPAVKEDGSRTMSSLFGEAATAAIDKKAKKKLTMRFELELFSPTDDKFPEFNYVHLVQMEKKKQKMLKQKMNGAMSSGDPFDEDDDVARIAKELERKYGNSYSGSRGRSENYKDIGQGYDESDSFIDNTEAYDEIVPEDKETIGGGFYINSGRLEFKKLQTFEKTDELIKMPERPRKRAHSSSSSGEDSSDEETDKDLSVNKPSKVPAVDEQESGKAELVTASTEKRPKKDKEKEKKEDKEKEKEKKDDVIKTITVKDMLKAKRDNYLKGIEKSGKPVNGEVKSSQSDSSGSDNESDDSSAKKKVNGEEGVSKATEGGVVEKSEAVEVLLPPDLPIDVLEKVNEFKESCKLKGLGGKKIHLDDHQKDILIKLEQACNAVYKAGKGTVYGHLEFALNLPKNLLLRKLKQIIKEEKAKVKKCLAKMKKAVDECMPTVIVNYQISFKRIEDARAAIGPEELKKMENPPKFPRKKFPWNDTFRTLLYEICEVRKSSFPILRSRKESLEDFLTEFLKTKVLEIWPNGWTKYEDLKKELARKEKKIREDPHHKSHNNNNNNLNNNNDKQSKPMEPVPQQSKPSTSPPAAAQKPISLDVTSPARRTDHSIISIMSLTSPSPSSSKNHSQNDVQSTSIVKIEVPETTASVRRNSSGSDSDGVEIVGVYNAPSLPKKSNLLNVNRQRNANKSRSNSPLPLKKPTIDLDAQIDNNCSFKGLMTALKDLDVIDLS